MRCSQKTVEGRPCRKHAVTGSDRCAFHLGPAVGRRYKPLLTPELGDQLVAMLRAGNYVGVTCRAVGISRQAFYAWMERGATGAPGDEEFTALRARVEQAQAEGEARNVTQIAKAAATNWLAAAWLLERQYPERWGRVSVRLREDAPPAEPIPVEDEDDPFREVDQLAERRRLRERPPP